MARKLAAAVEMVPVREAWPLWMTTETAAKYLDFQNCKDPRDAFTSWVRRTGLVPRGRRGDVPLYHRADLDRSVTLVVDGMAPKAVAS